MNEADPEGTDPDEKKELEEDRNDGGEEGSDTALASYQTSDQNWGQRTASFIKSESPGLGVDPIPGLETMLKSGLRYLNGRFAPNNYRPGFDAEVAAKTILDSREGWTYLNGQTRVTNAAGQVRRYDYLYYNQKGTLLGVEVKSGTGYRNEYQRSFDSGVTSQTPAVGYVGGKFYEIKGTDLLKVPAQ